MFPVYLQINYITIEYTVKKAIRLET